MKKLFLPALALLSSLGGFGASEARAAESTFFSARLGYPSLTVALDPRLQPALGSAAFVGVEAFRTLADLPIAFGVFTQAFVGGAFGGLPVLQAGVSIYYFPFSRLETSYSIDDEVTMKSSAWTPYLKLQPGFEFMNFKNEENGAVFGSSSLAYVLSAGIMIPAGETNRWGAEIGYTSTMGAKDAKENPISVSGLLASIHYTFYLP